MTSNQNNEPQGGPVPKLGGKVEWKSPSNIALIKYWGKHGVQLPQNASISFTLDVAHTNMCVRFTPKTQDDKKISLDFLFESQPNAAFEQKIIKQLEKYLVHFSWVTGYKLHIESDNSFPHSSGIASSASSMSALALCLCDIESQLQSKELDLRKASEVARLFSGSASRSVFPYVAIWGETPEIAASSDLNAIPYESQVDPIFNRFRNDILIISTAEKSVSSTVGHGLMNGNIYANTRYRSAENNMRILLKAMGAGDLEKFGEIVESEALQLHALMMCSEPSFILMEANTLEAIKAIRKFRKEQQLHLYFTLDAGPNIHLLYPEEIADRVEPFVEEVLKPLCVNGRIIKDRVGSGPIKIS